MTVLPLLAAAILNQVVITGRLETARFPGSEEAFPLPGVLVFGSLAGSGADALPSRTWEAHPAGWFHLSGTAGRYTLLVSTPARFARPVVLTSVFVEDGARLDLPVHARFEHASFPEADWDREPARAYWQLFTARGTGITSVGFKLATDGVDGVGPGSQAVGIAILREGTGAPDTWEPVGPEAIAPEVDCGGPKSYSYSAGWASGEVPTHPGRTYAVRLRSVDPSRRLQAFWRAAPGARCFRAGPSGAAMVEREMWLAVASDGDGLLIACPKRVHKEFTALTRMGRRWTQTWKAKGRGLAGVVLYAAVSGAQPPLSRQRVALRVRRGGPAGPRVGIEKIGIGNGNYTGDASWGAFGAAFAPGEVDLEPGQTYALEAESAESLHTLEGFINIKGQVSDGRPGFNPYRRHPLDPHEEGEAFLDGEKVDFDLDLQVIEYEHTEWERGPGGGGVDRELLSNGGMEDGAPEPAGWRPFSSGKAARHRRIDAGPERGKALRLEGAGSKEEPVDGGWVARVDGLSPHETYRLTGLVRSTWPLDLHRAARVGIDPTGQVDDPRAPTIRWTALPPRHGVFVSHESAPIRPAAGSVSIWLHARCDAPGLIPFRADFDDVSLRRWHTGPPHGK